MGILIGFRISKFLRPVQRNGDFEIIRITCQAACLDKTEHGIFVKFKNPAKLLSPYLPVSPPRALRAPGTSPYHLVLKHLWTTWSRLEQSHLISEAFFPNGTDKVRQHQRQTERPPPEYSTFLRDFTLYKTTNCAISWKWCLNNRKKTQALMSWRKNGNFFKVPYLQIFAPGAALWWFQPHQNHFPSRLSWQNWTWHICQV